MKIKIFLLSSIISLCVLRISAQDSSFRQSPSGLTVAEGKLAYVRLRSDFIDDKDTKEKGNYGGIGAAFSTNLFRRANEATRFRHADYENLGAAIGAGSTGLWVNIRTDLGWQFHYAVDKKVDVGMRVYGTFMYDKISFMGVLFQPSIKLGSFYLDYTNGVQVKFGNTLNRNYQEFNLRFLFPNDESYDMDRWYVGYKTITVLGENHNQSKTTTRMTQGMITVGLML